MYLPVSFPGHFAITFTHLVLLWLETSHFVVTIVIQIVNIC